MVTRARSLPPRPRRRRDPDPDPDRRRDDRRAGNGSVGNGGGGGSKRARIVPRDDDDNDDAGDGRSRAPDADGGSSSGDDDRTAPNRGRCPDVSSRYEKLGRIGEGTYGVVYRARDKRTGNVVALKRCLPHHEASDGFPLTTLREITLLRELGAEEEEDRNGRGGGGSNGSIVRLKDVAVSSSRSGVFLVFEYAEHDLATLLDDHYRTARRSPFREGEAKRLLVQLLSALSFLHSRCVIHRDLKTCNLLYNHRGELKVADFGLARRVGSNQIRSYRRGGGVGGWNGNGNGGGGFCSAPSPPPPRNGAPRESRAGDGDGDAVLRGSRLTSNVVSLWYRPPELLFGSETYDDAVDDWGAGCVMGELLKGRALLNGRNPPEQVQKVFNFLGPPNVDDWPDLRNMPLIKNGSIGIPSRKHVLSSPSTEAGCHMLDVFSGLSSAGLRLISGLMRYDPSKRWTAEEALSSDYFTEFPTPTSLGMMPTFPTKHGK